MKQFNPKKSSFNSKNIFYFFKKLVMVWFETIDLTHQTIAIVRDLGYILRNNIISEEVEGDFGDYDELTKFIA